MGLFKSSDELLEKGHDFVKLREFKKAQDTFEKSAEKAQKNGEQDVFVVSNALAKVMLLSEVGFTYQNYINSMQALIPLGEGEIKIGIKSIKAAVLANECRISADEVSVQGVPNTVQGLTQRAGKLQSIGVEYQTQIGSNTLFLPELFFNRNETGIQRSMRLFAESQENMAEATVWSDPKRAAEYYQNAVNYRKQIGDSQSENADLEKVAQYSRSASCWFCGREITGEQVHFFPMNSDITMMLRTSKGESPLPSVHES
jgi:tetratricopeptide (TPR) repeat protein